MESKPNRRRVVAGLVAFAGCALVRPASARAAFAPTRFSVEIRGSGPDVILIPGLATSRAVWRDTAAALPGYRYHLIQLAGFAGEPARGNAKGGIVSGVAAELARYIADNRLRRPALVGHSMGGTIAMRVAARHPALVGRIMVVDMLPQPSGMVGSTPDRVRGLADGLRDLAQAPGGRELIASLVGLFAAPHDPGTRSDPDVVAQAMHELATLDLTDELPRILAPMTVVYASLGASDRGPMDRIYAAAYGSRPQTRLLRIDNSGHMVMADQPAAFRAALRGFFAG